MSDYASRPLILVDVRDNIIGEGEKYHIHHQGLLHRAFSICILREEPSGPAVLLQQRHAEKYHSGRLWSNSCCGHPTAGEDTKSAAQRRLREELGITLSLIHIGVFHYHASIPFSACTENEIDHVFVGYDQGEKLLINPSEVMDYQWVSLKHVIQDAQENSEKYTVWCLTVFNTVYNWWEQSNITPMLS